MAAAVAAAPRAFARDLRGLLGSYAARAPVEPSISAVRPVRASVAAGEPSLNVLLPRLVLASMSGGPNTALGLTLRLARDGMPVRYVSTDVGAAEPDTLWRHFESVTGISGPLDNVAIVDADDPDTTFGRHDVFFATAWWTAHKLKPLLRETQGKEFVYLIQDFEPGFYPWSTEHALALETYGLPFRGVINESLLRDHFVTNRIGRFAVPGFADTCAVFEPAVDAQLFRPERPRARSRRQLLYYTRPSAPRNLYDLGVEALRSAVEAGGFASEEWELLAMGDPVEPVALGRDVVLKPTAWRSYDEYAELVRTSDLGLALMLSPHTGYPVLELAASGVPVVTNVFSTKTAARLAELSPAIVAAEPSVEAVADALLAASGLAVLESRTLSLPSTWDEAFEPLLPQLRELIESCRASA